MNSFICFLLLAGIRELLNRLRIFLRRDGRVARTWAILALVFMVLGLFYLHQTIFFSIYYLPAYPNVLKQIVPPWIHRIFFILVGGLSVVHVIAIGFTPWLRSLTWLKSEKPPIPFISACSLAITIAPFYYGGIVYKMRLEWSSILCSLFLTLDFFCLEAALIPRYSYGVTQMTLGTLVACCFNLFRRNQAGAESYVICALCAWAFECIHRWLHRQPPTSITVAMENTRATENPTTATIPTNTTAEAPSPTTMEAQ